MHPRIPARSLSGLLALAVLPLALSACSSGGSGGSDPAVAEGLASPAAAASSSADPNSGLPTGTLLKGDLLTSGLPSAYALDSSGSVDTGDSFQDPSATSAAPACSALDATSWIRLAGYNPVSFAQSDYVDKADSEEYAQEIDTYQGTTAQDVMTALAKIHTTCPTFADTATHSTVSVVVSTASTPGDGSVTIALHDTAWVGFTTLVAVRVNHSVVSVLSSATSDSTSFATQRATSIAANLKAGAN